MATPQVFDVLGAKKDGYSDKEIAEYLASKTGFDVEGSIKDGYSPKEIINYLNKTEATPVETFLETAKQEAGSEITGALQLLGREPTDTAEESLRRQMASENPIAGVLGTFAGGLINPSTLLPGTLLAKGAKGAALAGALAGGAGGFLQPRYEEEDLSRVASTALGSVAGGALAGGLAKLLEKYGSAAVKAVDLDVTKGDIEKKATDLPEVMDTVATKADTATADLNRVVDNSDAGLEVPENTIVDIFNPYDIKLPKDLAGAKPQYGRNVTQFDSDLDKALYIIGNKKELSNADQRYMDWVKETTGISDENIIRDLGKKVKDHVKNTPDKGAIPYSRLEELLPVKQAINPLGESSAAVTINPFVTKFDVNFPLAGDSNAWKTLDTNSKLVYNIGRQILEGDASKVVPKFSLKDPNVKTAFDEVITAIPGIKRKDAGEVMLKYAKTMEDLSKAHGKDWTPTNFKQFVQEGGVTELDRIALAKAGLLDGCNL